MELSCAVHMPPICAVLPISYLAAVMDIEVIVGYWYLFFCVL